MRSFSVLVYKARSAKNEQTSVCKVYLSRSLQGGFSLLELVVVVAVLAILASIAIPSFGSLLHIARVNAAKSAVVAAFKECLASASSGGTSTFSYSKPVSFTFVSADNSVNYLEHMNYIDSQGRGICHDSGIRVNPDVGATYPEFIISKDGVKSCNSGAPSVSAYWQLGCTGAPQQRGSWR